MDFRFSPCFCDIVVKVFFFMHHLVCVLITIYFLNRKKSKSMKRMVCDCTTSKSDRAMGIPGCGSDCLNRMLMIEW